jgi:hypothetical protein
MLTLPPEAAMSADSICRSMALIIVSISAFGGNRNGLPLLAGSMFLHPKPPEAVLGADSICRSVALF